MSRKNRKGVPTGKPSRQRDKSANQDTDDAAIVKAHMPPANGDQGDRKNKGRDAFEITGLVIQIITLVVLGIYTGINYFLYDNSVQTLQASEQAFIFVTGVEIRPHDPVPYEFIKTAPAYVIVKIKNSGNTVARQLHTSMNMMVNPSDNFDYPDFAGGQRNPDFLGPQYETSLVLSTTYANMLSVRQGYSRLKVYGHIEYVDAVLNKPHRTWFCYDYMSIPAAPHTVGYETFDPCDGHNCIDDDCQEPWDFMPKVVQPIEGPVTLDLPPTPTTTATSTPVARRGRSH